MGNFRRSNQNSRKSNQNGNGSTHPRKTNSRSKTTGDKNEKVGWTNLRQGRSASKKAAPVVELSSDTDFEEPRDAENPQVIHVDSDDEESHGATDDIASTVVIVNVSDDAEEEETHQEAANSSSPTDNAQRSEQNVSSLIAEDSRNVNQDDNAGDEWGRDSDDQASYVTFFNPKTSLLQANKDGENEDEGIDDTAPSDSDFEPTPAVNVEGESSLSNSHDSINAESNEDLEESDFEVELASEISSSSQSGSQRGQSSSPEVLTSRLRSKRKRTIVNKASTSGSNTKRMRLDTKKKKTTTAPKAKAKSNKRVTRRTSRQSKQSKEKDTDESSNSSSQSSNSESEEEIRNSSRKRLRTRQSKRQITPKKLTALQQKQKDAFEQLRMIRANNANKPKRKSPVRQTNSSDENEDDGSSDDSSYTSGPSPVPIVSNSSDDGTDFDDDGSTPSSSSVTSSGETDEEPDLEIGGSDGEKDLPNDEEVDENKEEKDVASCSSSSDEEPPLDNQNDQRCILCKNLQSAKIVGRAKYNIDPQDWCKCGECVKFSPNVRDYDLVCCRELKTVKDFLKEELEDKNVCITKHPRFDSDVLKNEGFARSISKHKLPANSWNKSYWQDHDDRYTSRRTRVGCAARATTAFERSNMVDKTWKSFSSYKYWIFDKLNDNDSRQMVIPACVKAKIYDTFRTSSQFIPYRARMICPHAQHCRPASTQY
ncbi:unnamed protein product [Orchesella dallaii]|uniref:Uncharacterized protein n=1 Tax=Orchesella dallaii TaxID=48710 RepID=A0ABP1QNG9_9HEXA